MTGGKPVITKFLQSVMDPGDEVLYPNPGFPIYESQIEYLGGVAAAVPATCRPRTGSRSTWTRCAALITPNTVAIIYNDLQNPISAESSAAEREAVAAAGASEHDLWVLSDEAYFEMRYAGDLELDRRTPGHGRAHGHPLHVQEEVRHDRLAARLRRRAASSSPTIFSKLNTNDESCTTHYVQWAGSRRSAAPSSPSLDMLDAAA